MDLIPVHQPKMNWLVSFLNSIALYPVTNTARILIASHERDVVYFREALASHPLAKHLLFLNAEKWIDDTFHAGRLIEQLRHNNDRCAINLKKSQGCAGRWITGRIWRRFVSCRTCLYGCISTGFSDTVACGVL
jgi:hypothetical protein